MILAATNGLARCHTSCVGRRRFHKESVRVRDRLGGQMTVLLTALLGFLHRVGVVADNEGPSRERQEEDGCRRTSTHDESRAQ